MARKSFRGRCMSAHKAPAGYVHLALCLNYAGTAFRGLQIQTAGPTHHTVEGVVLQALADAALIEGVERGRPTSAAHHFARACRTDRGVHATRNLVSLFVHRDAFAAAGECAGICERLNALLPAQVRVAAVSRVLGSFIPRNCCNRRVYRYLLPAYALLPPADGWATLDRFHAGWAEGVGAMVRAVSGARVCGESADARAMVDDLYVDLTREAGRQASGDDVGVPGGAAAAPLLAALTDSVARCNAVLSEYFVGSHRFHNFSVDAEAAPGGPRTSTAKVVPPDSEEARRVIYRCEIAPRVFLLPRPTSNGGGASVAEYAANSTLAPAEGAAGVGLDTPVMGLPTHLPFLVFQVEGGSFLLHMIRKMVGAALAVCRGARPTLVAEALSPERRVTTPLAPGSYLFLALSTYHGYDRTLRAMAAHRLTQKERAAAGVTGGGSSKDPPADEAEPDAVSVYQPLQSDWGGPVAAACERFAAKVIAADVVDVDLGLVPPLDEMLAARDRARRVTRPQWEREDAHLASMKEYTPSEVLAGRSRRCASSTAGVAPPSPPTEMTRFLRMLRVHNWGVRTVPLPPDSKAMLEEKNKRARREEVAGGAAADADADGSPTEPAVPAESTAHREETIPSAATASSTGPVADVPDGGEDGWIYVAATPEEERALRQRYFAQRWRRSRPWEYGSADGAGTTTGEGDSSDGIVSEAGSE